MNSLNVADILYVVDTSEHLLLLKRRTEERDNGFSVTDDYVWDMIDISSGSKFWEWEFVLMESGCYERVA